ncbi:MAG: contact-dependent growth inhibition system immunity protein [Cyclobacteriaceae bacterium]
MTPVDYSKSLEQLENNYWDEPTYNSYVVTTSHAMRKKPLNEVTVDELRLAIGQGFGLDYLMPMAIEILKRDILTEGDLFEGDLLANVISRSTFNYWKLNKRHWNLVVRLIEQHKDILTDKDIVKNIPDFMEIHKTFV